MDLSGKKLLYSIVHDITDSKKIEEALNKSRKREKYLANLLEYSAQPFGVGYPDGRLGLTNKAFEDITGYTREELERIDWSKILTPKEFQDMELEKLEELQRTGQPVRYEKEYIRKDGTRVPIELLVDMVKNKDGTPKYYYSFISDISERKQTEEVIKKTVERFYSILSNMRASVLLVTEHNLVEYVNQAFCDYFDLKEEPAELIGITDKKMIQIIKDVYQNPDEILHIKNIVDDWKPVIGEEITMQDGKTCIRDFIPLNIGDEPYGRLWVHIDITARKKFESELNTHRENLENLVEARTKELEDAYESLKESKEHYLTLFNSIDEAFCTIEVIFDDNNKPVDYRFLEVNPAFVEQTGLVDAEGKLMRELEPDHEEYWFDIYGHIALTGKAMRFVNEAKALNRWYDVFAFNVGSSKHEVAILFNDITKFKKTEEALKLSSIYNRSLIEASLDPLVTIGPDGKITDVNTATENVTGISRDDLIGTDFSDYFSEPEKARSGYKQVFREGSVHDYPLEIKHKNGGRTPVLYNASTYKNELGKIIGVFAAARDVTEMKKAEKEIKEYQETLEKQGEDAYRRTCKIQC